MKSYLMKALPVAGTFVFLSLAARADFSDRIDLVHRGMSARAAVAILGEPSKVTQGPSGSINFNYFTPAGTWQLTVLAGRVISIQEQ